MFVRDCKQNDNNRNNQYMQLIIYINKTGR